MDDLQEAPNSPGPRTPFIKELEGLINSHSQENQSNTPDFILAEFLMNCLYAFGQCVRNRDAWFDVDMWSADKRTQKFRDSQTKDESSKPEIGSAIIPPESFTPVIASELAGILNVISAHTNAKTDDEFTPSEDNFNREMNQTDCIIQVKEIIYKLVKKYS